MNVSKLIIAAVAASLSFGAFAESLDKKEEGTKIAKHEKSVKNIALQAQKTHKSAKNEVEKAKKLAKKGMPSKIS